MANVNSKKIARIGVFILWVITVGMLLFRFAIELESYIREIGYATPEYVELTSEELEELERGGEINESIVAQIAPDDEDNQASNTQSQIENKDFLENNHQTLAKLEKERNLVIAKIILLVMYLVLGIVVFVRLRNKENTRTIIFASLALINVMVLFMLPEMFIPSSPYSIRYITNA